MLSPRRASAEPKRQRIRTGAAVFPEHSIVGLRSAVILDDGRSLPRGARGAIVGVWAEGKAYEVEFVEPFHAIVTVEAGLLAGEGSPGRA